VWSGDTESSERRLEAHVAVGLDCSLRTGRGAPTFRVLLLPEGAAKEVAYSGGRVRVTF
jgi:hypothetical protein